MSIGAVFVCQSCFSLRKACFLWAGDGRWLVLPLLPKVRDPKATPEDAGYNIEQGTIKHRGFPDTWEIEPKKRPRKWTWKKCKIDQGDGRMMHLAKS